ncbi:MAG: hypothetical protein KAS02_01650 [Candidatus Pacebacteria bacterium]|nr:hypothetical protein [Candidatus Paceibacterota bacterium]
MKIKDRLGLTLEVDTSDEAFKSLPQTFLQKHRSGEEVSVGVGMFKILGVAPLRGRLRIKVIYGYFESEERASYFYLPSRKV